jgi:hypothetical protein
LEQIKTPTADDSFDKAPRLAKESCWLLADVLLPRDHVIRRCPPKSRDMPSGDYGSNVGVLLAARSGNVLHDHVEQFAIQVVDGHNVLHGNVVGSKQSTPL